MTEEVLQVSESPAGQGGDRPAGEALPAGKRPSWLRFWWLPVLLLLSGYLALKNLASASFWCDEAHVTIMARNFVDQGVMTGWSGRNLYGYANGGALNGALRPINAPLDIWITAAAFKLLGERGEWAARLPFALLGLLTIPVFARLVWVESRRNHLLTFFATASLGLSTAFLLYIRQARYFSLSILAPVLILYGYRSYLHSHKPGPLVVLVLGAVTLFYANPMQCAVLLLALGITHLVMRPGDWSRGEWLGFAAAAWAFLMLTVPYAVYYEIWYRPDHNFSNDPWLLSKAKLIGRNFRDVIYTAPLTYVVLPAALWCALRPAAQDPGVTHRAREWFLLAAVYLLLLSIVSPQVTNFVWPADVRYQTSIFPTLAALAGAGLWRVAVVSRPAAVALFLVLITVVPWTLHPLWPKTQWLLPGLVKEIHQPYPTAGAAVADFLRKNANQDDVIFSSPEYMNYPIEYAVGDKVRIGSVLNEGTHLPPKATEKLPDFVWEEKARPEWLILYGQREFIWATKYTELERLDEKSGGDVPLYVIRPLNYTMVARLDYYRYETQRPELVHHEFGPKREFDREMDAVYILKRSGDVKYRKLNLSTKAGLDAFLRRGN